MNVSRYRQASGAPFHVTESSMPPNKTCNALSYEDYLPSSKVSTGLCLHPQSFSGHHLIKEAHVEGWFPGMRIAKKMNPQKSDPETAKS